MENEILKEVVEYGQSRKWVVHAPLLLKDKERNSTGQPGFNRVACAIIPSGQSSRRLAGQAL